MEHQRLREPEKPPIEEQKKQKQTITAYVGRMGQDTKVLQLTKGTTLGDVVKTEKAENLEVRLNNTNAPKHTELQEGDVVVVVPQAVRGGEL